MRSLWIVLAMFTFTLACTQTGPAIGVKQEKTGPKETAEATKKPSGAVKAATAKEKEAKPDEKTPAAGARPAREVAAKQQEADAQRASTAERLSQLVAAAAEEAKTAAGKQQVAAEEGLMREITGLIMQETMTKVGYDFYEYFFLRWEAPQGIAVKDYNIVIAERASPMWGSWVQVDVNERTIWNSMLRPRSEEIEEAAQQAMEVTKEYLINYEKYQMKTPDLVGTGI